MFTKFDELPDEVKCKVFSYVDLADFPNVACVCRSWSLILNDSVTWTIKLENSNVYAGSDILYHLLMNSQFMRNYFILNSKSNFLKNVNMDKGQENWGSSREKKESHAPVTIGWDISGDWMIENHVGCDPFPVEAGPASNNTVTSYQRCIRRQEVCLSGYMPNISALGHDGFKVRVFWSVWVAPRYDCGSKYSAYLKTKGVKIVLADVRLNAGKEWRKLSKTIELEIPSEESSFTYKEVGQDSKFWDGHYGAKILNPVIRVKIIPPN